MTVRRRAPPRAAPATRGWPPSRPPSRSTRGTAPLAGGGSIPSPLAVKLDGGIDAVRQRFAKPFGKAPRAGLLFDLDTGRVLWRRKPTKVAPDRVADQDDDRARGHRSRCRQRARADHAAGARLPRARASGCCRAARRSRCARCSTGCCCRRATTRRSRSPSARAGTVRRFVG